MRMVCPKCKAVNTVHNQHNIRLVCVSCGYAVERLPDAPSPVAVDAFDKRIEEFSANA